MTTEGEQREVVCGRCGDGEPIDKEMDANHRASHGHPFTPAPVVPSDDPSWPTEREYEEEHMTPPTPSQDAEGGGREGGYISDGEMRAAWEKRYRQRVARFNDTPELVELGVRTHPMPDEYAAGWLDAESAIREPYEALVKAARGVLDSRTEFVFENGSGFEETSFEYDENAVACLNAALTRIEESLGGRS